MDIRNCPEFNQATGGDQKLTNDHDHLLCLVCSKSIYQDNVLVKGFVGVGVER
jgi:hypothetical protein